MKLQTNISSLNKGSWLFPLNLMFDSILQAALETIVSRYYITGP